jgi:hypothetical protein
MGWYHPNTASLGLGLCGSDASIYNKLSIQDTLYHPDWTYNDRSSGTTLNLLKLLKAKICQKHPSRIFFISPGWHVTHDLNLLSLIMRVNSNVSSNEYVNKKIMALKPNQLQVTAYHPQANVIKTCENLYVEEQHQLKTLLQKYEHLFDGTLGEFNMDTIQISLQLMDPNFKPIHARVYTVPRTVEQ